MELKSTADRVTETIRIVRKLTESLQLDAESPEIAELRQHMNTYIRTGETWKGIVDFSRWGREAHCVFPKYKNQTVEVTLKVIKQNPDSTHTGQPGIPSETN
uniref:Uncharacterized protein n=1 Tax=viral metagenome TaxID=1070528 RepID=A0A6C0KV69_9ZZZZ